MEARVGFEPTNGGLADLSLRPLGYRAEASKYNETYMHLSVAVRNGSVQTLVSHANLFKNFVDLARRRRHDLGFAYEACGFLWRGGTNVESRTPLEARHFGEFWNDLDMPVVVVVGFFANGRGVNH